LLDSECIRVTQVASMKFQLIQFTALLLCLTANFFAVETTVFTTAEIRVDFAGPFNVRIEPGATVYRDLFPRPLQTVDFCQWQAQDPEVQQISRPETGYLCEMHVLHVRSAQDIMSAVRKSTETKRADRATNRDLTYSEIHGLKVISWRFQAGKTRLDHYLLLGNKYNYLFISSPYGSHGTIESVLKMTTLR
jgi:hypothetical protein